MTASAGGWATAMTGWTLTAQGQRALGRRFPERVDWDGFYAPRN
ncbi:hypothetical protein [Ponticoccus litoralis]|uniref:Uncharacterized protein n=1 Tax=Ponticoccus litoralis TaxID=422297 RepID=A0AAW9SNW1_9RHOB